MDISSSLKEGLENYGISLNLNDQDKLLELWKVFQLKEKQLNEAQVKVDDLCTQQERELTGVSDYVEQIKGLSEERDALTEELQFENDLLRRRVEDSTGVSKSQLDEIAEMLTEQGLDEIADATPCEQVAYLLVERARLQNDLEVCTERLKLGQSQTEDHLTISKVSSAGAKTGPHYLAGSALETVSKNDLKNIHQKLKEQIDDLKKTINFLSNENASLVNELRTIKNSTSLNSKSVDQAMSRNLDLESDLFKIRSELESMRREKEDLYIRSNKLETELKYSQQKLKTTENEIDLMRSEYKSLLTQKSKVEERLEKLQTALEHAENKSHSMEHAENKPYSLPDDQNTYDSVSSKTTPYLETLPVKPTTIDYNSSSLEELKQCISRLTNENQVLAERINLLTEQNQKLQDQLETDTQFRLPAVDRHNSNTTSGNRTLQRMDSRDKIHEAALQLESQNGKLFSKLQQCYSDLDDLKLENTRLEQQNAKLLQKNSSSVKEMETENKILTLKLTQAERKIASNNKENEPKPTNVHLKRDQNEFLSGSTSDDTTDSQRIKEMECRLSEVNLSKVKQHREIESLRQRAESAQVKFKVTEQRNAELKEMLVSMEARIELMKKSRQTDSEEDSQLERASATAKYLSLQQELDETRIQLAECQDRYERQCRRYSERQTRTKQKLQTARDRFNAERGRLRRAVSSSDENLVDARLQLEKETKVRAGVDVRHQQVLIEKRHLLEKVADFEEACNDAEREKAILAVRLNYTESENARLAEQVETLKQQIRTHEAIINEYKRERNGQVYD